MRIPEYVKKCMDALEAAGFQAYAVGGCVRDSWLGLQPHDYDMCTDALPEQTEEVFRDYRLVLAGKKHGTITVVMDGELVEITTFRTEGGYLDNRHPDWVKFVPDIKEDLSRRDFTVNAMAYSPTRGYADPFGGREDLENKRLRAVGDPVQRFREDSLRILRGVRFAVKYRLDVDPETEKAMHSEAHLMENLARERVFDELCKLLPLVTAADLKRFAPILGAVIPELKPMVDFDQHSPHHAYDLYTHVAHVVEGVPGELPLRWAALLHDVGKISCFTQEESGRGHFYGHAEAGSQLSDGILRRLKAPNALREQVLVLIGNHMTRVPANVKPLRRWVGRLGWETMEQLLKLQEADMGSKGTGKAENMEQFAQLRALLEEIRQESQCLTLKDLAVNGHDLMALGYQGKEVGRKLEGLLELVMDEAVPNTKEALLAIAGEI